MQGRPKGVTPKFSLAPIVPRLSELLGIQVFICSTSLVLQTGSDMVCAIDRTD